MKQEKRLSFWRLHEVEQVKLCRLKKDPIPRIEKTTSYKQAFDSIAESLSSDAMGRFVALFILWITRQNVPVYVERRELVTAITFQCSWSLKKIFRWPIYFLYFTSVGLMDSVFILHCLSTAILTEGFFGQISFF